MVWATRSLALDALGIGGEKRLPPAGRRGVPLHVRFLDIRQVNLQKFPYGVFYFVVGDAVVVLAMLHGARDTEAELSRRRKVYG